MKYEADEFADILRHAPATDEFASLLLVNNESVALDLALRGFAVFPICDWDDGDGWKPIKGFLEKATSAPRQICDWWATWPEARVGLLTGERNGVTVLDVDLKYGKDGVASLRALGFPDVEAMSPVRVRTPSGGWHLFFQWSPSLKNSVSRLGSGIDVKTTGGFVVAPGSLKDGRRYEIAGAALGDAALPEFPTSLIPPPEPERVAVEAVTDATDTQRAWANEQLHAKAEHLAEVGEGGRNNALNDIVMWTAGAAAHGFIGESDARVALWAAAESTGIRKREFDATFRSAWKAGLKKPIESFPRDTTAEEFDEIVDEVSATNPVTARLNRRHAVVMVKGRSLIATERKGGSVDFGQVRDLHSWYENDRVPAGDGKKEPASRRWMRDPERRQYPDGVTFAPGGCSMGALNLWRGWGVEADATASCDLFLEHIRTVVCFGNADHAAYVVGWLAHLVQRPDEKPGVALVLKGGKGAGKDTVAEYVARMIGRRHAPTVAETDHIVGKFNARLENALLLHVQEGSWAGDRKAEGVLKYYVTSERIEIERKGIDSINLPSVLRLFISANADWVVPASPDERRWAVFEVSNARRGDDAYFAALRHEMDNRGPAALLHFLRSYDLTGFNVRAAPETEGLRNQKIASLRNVELWWFEILSKARISACYDDSDDWKSVLSVGRDALRGQYVEWMKGRRYDGSTIEERYFGRRLREMVPALADCRPRPKGGAPRSRQYVLPSLKDCREAFDAWIGSAVDWDAPE